MSLQSGTQLGPYEILSQIGAGGMGEVYKARDTRLNRIVAIKVLPEHLAEQPELRERFKREAETIAKLNHPHICTLHDIGQQDGTDFLVMEYLEGETLAERLKKGPLPLDQVLRYAVEVSDALDKAHRAGVTHRDIKPGNIIVTKDGTKLLDFGLAKLKQEVAKATIPASEMPTVPGALTEHGTLLGTLHYMAPEQVEGKVNEIDARTDIFAFGALVYEMGTGKRAFPGDTQASVIAKILEVDPPPMSTLQPMTPPALDRVVKKCLRKDAEDRWQSVRDVTDELKWITEGGGKVGTVAAAGAIPARPLWRRAMPFVLTGLAAAAISVGVATWNRPETPDSRLVSHLAVTLPAEDPIQVFFSHSVAISPDGSQVVYVGGGEGGQLYLRSLDSPDVKPIPGTQGGHDPFFSPNGQWLGFFAQGKLMKVAVSGGASLTICEARFGGGGTWGGDDTIVFDGFTAEGSSLFRVSAAGGTPTLLTQPDSAKGETGHIWPAFLPGGKTVLFTAQKGADWDNAQIESLNLESGERRVLVRGGTFPRYAPTGHLVYYLDGTVMAVPFDPDRLEVTGAPSPVLEGVMSSVISNSNPTGTGVAQLAFSKTGSLVYIAGLQTDERTLVWMDRNGAVEPIGTPPRAYRQPALSPDGRQVAVTIDDQTSDIWVYDIPRGTLTRLTFEGNNRRPSWTPDGTRVVFPSERGGTINLFWKLADGTGPVEQLSRDEDQVQSAQSISPDGRLAFFTQGPNVNNDIWTLELQGERKANPYLKTPFDESGATISPDGRWLAYYSTDSGRFEVYVRPFPSPSSKWQISTEGAQAPRWARDGRELFYVSYSDKLMAVDITTEPSFQAGTPRVLLEEARSLRGGQGANYDPAPDGQRFLTVQGSEANLTQLHVILNWFEELKQRVPVQ